VSDRPSFELQVRDPSGARVGRLITARAEVPTPAFMPVATQGAVKALAGEDLLQAGAMMLLANAYHLYLRPGSELVRRLGGLHRFMAWPGPILTDSGGFQVFSLGPFRRVSEEGVQFVSHWDGTRHLFTPEAALVHQEALGADIAMVLDEPPAYGASEEEVRAATERTHRWALRSLQARQRPDQAVYGIIQGGTFPVLRRASAEAVAAMPFDGYAIGGLSFGEPKERTWAMVEESTPFLPTDRPRYLMGVGSPEDLLDGIARGIDLFDSALPTRVARHGALFTPEGRVNVTAARFRDQDVPIDATCDCATCTRVSVAYLHHLFRSRELLAYRLAATHNLRFILGLLEQGREAIKEGRFASFHAGFSAGYRSTDEAVRWEQRIAYGRAASRPRVAAKRERHREAASPA